MQLSPVRRPGEAQSAYYFRYARFSFQWLVALGLPLGLMLAARPDAAQSPLPMLVMLLYLVFGLGTGMALLSMVGFAIGGVLARLSGDDRPGPMAQDTVAPVHARAPMPRWPWAVVGVAWLAGLWIALFAPYSVLDEFPALRAYESFMATFSNPGNLLGTKSAFPQVTRAYHAVAIWSLPAWLVLWWSWMNRQLGPNRTDLLFKVRLSTANRLFLLITLPLWLGLAYAILWWNHGGDTRLFAFGTSRLQLALFGMLAQVACAGTLALAAFSARRLLRLTWADRSPQRRA